MNGTSVGDIVAGIVIAWFIIKGLERLADLLARNNYETETKMEGNKG
jgi:hypothetical protein